jgi:hypothetical protein
MIDRLKALLTRPQPQKSDGDTAIGEAMAAIRDATVKFGTASFAAGAREERERIEAIARLPHAARFPATTLGLIVSEFVTVEAAAAELEAEAQREALAMAQPTESPTFEDGRAPTIH